MYYNVFILINTSSKKSFFFWFFPFDIAYNNITKNPTLKYIDTFLKMILNFSRTIDFNLVERADLKILLY